MAAELAALAAAAAAAWRDADAASRSAEDEAASASAAAARVRAGGPTTVLAPLAGGGPLVEATLSSKRIVPLGGADGYAVELAPGRAAAALDRRAAAARAQAAGLAAAASAAADRAELAAELAAVSTVGDEGEGGDAAHIGEPYDEAVHGCSARRRPGDAAPRPPPRPTPRDDDFGFMDRLLAAEEAAAGGSGSAAAPPPAPGLRRGFLGPAPAARAPLKSALKKGGEVMGPAGVPRARAGGAGGAPAVRARACARVHRRRARAGRRRRANAATGARRRLLCPRAREPLPRRAPRRRLTPAPTRDATRCTRRSDGIEGVRVGGVGGAHRK